MWYPCGACRFCENCQGGFAPREWQVEVSSLANRTPPTCGDCSSLNGAYILKPSASCTWQYTLPAPICGVTHIRLTIGVTMPSPPRWGIVVELLDATNTVLMSVTKEYNTRPSCNTLSAELLGALVGPWSGGICDGTASSVEDRKSVV